MFFLQFPVFSYGICVSLFPLYQVVSEPGRVSVTIGLVFQQPPDWQKPKPHMISYICPFYPNLFVCLFLTVISLTSLYFLTVILEITVVAILVLITGVGIERVVVGEFLIFIITGEALLHLTVRAYAVIWLSSRQAFSATCAVCFLWPTKGVDRTLDVEQWKSIAFSEATGGGQLKTQETYSHCE